MEVKNYNLEFEIDLERKIFKGREEIEVSLNTKENFEIDSIDLKINEVKVDEMAKDYKLTKNKIILKNKLSKGEHKIFIDFEGELREVLGGLYLSRYEEGGKVKYLATTQFEPAEARKAFPCFDHPSYKAVFNLTLIIDKNLKAISNTLPLKEEVIGKKKKIVFEPTPRMSTYLLYIGVGDFEFLEDKYKNIILRVVTTPGKTKGGYFALDCAKKFLSYLEDYFNYPYPLKKLDLISIPDFAAGAMENWGAITFRENLLLFFEGITSLQAKVRIAEVIAHELVHQWFGNLVTMKWWDDLWLNESFATYLAYKAVNYFYPKWEVMKEYVTTEVISGLSADALLSSHPVKVEVKNIEESTEIFDEISYEKGGSILRMIDNYLGEEKFRDGLRFYIKNYKYQNATSDNLWQALERKGKKVIQIMNDFILKTGFPLVSLIKKENSFYLQQERFTFLKNKEKTIWQIPIKAKINHREKKIIFAKDKLELPWRNFQTLILNKDFSGFYLVNYPEEILEKSLSQASEEEILSFLNDYYFLLKKGLKSLDDYYNFLEKLENRQEKFVLELILKQLNFLYYLFEDKKSLNYLEKFSLKALQLLGLEPKKYELPIELSLRNIAIFSLVKTGNKGIKNFIAQKFNDFLEGKIHPDLKSVVLSSAINFKNENYNKLLNYYLKTYIFEERVKILSAFGNIYNKKVLKKSWEFLFSDNVRFNQFIYFFASLANNLKAKTFAFSWFKNYWPRIERKSGGIGKSDFVLIRLLKEFIPLVGTFVKEKEIKKFLKQKNLKRFNKTIRVVLEKVAINRKFYENNKK
ncbi:MAG: M1 family metallopeptidase [Candidatus Aenigmatarchaeota archaeon]